ncbi:MAG: response regulator [Deltaproteobacteria bacterium]|nr:response regulator [Deltaproteobacteria bacterium]
MVVSAAPAAWENILASRARVLAVDDEPDFLEVIEDYLVDLDVELRTAPDPDAALARLAEAPADVLLVDLQMPKGGGRRLLAECARRHPDAACIVVTAWGSEPIAVEMLKELGAVDYLSKTALDDEVLARAIAGARIARRAGQAAAHRDLIVVGVEARDRLTLHALGYLTAQPGLRRLGRLAQAVDEARARGHRQVRVDLRHLEACSAVALGYLLEAGRRLEAAGGALEVAVAAAPRQVARVITSLERSAERPAGLIVAGR